MLLSKLVLSLALCATSHALQAAISVQPISPSSSPISPLLTLDYDLETLTAVVDNYSPPAAQEDVSVYRLGVYDSASKSWASSSSITSAVNFSKGYVPLILLTVDESGSVIQVTCQSRKVAEGTAGDVAPQVQVSRQQRGESPRLSKPVPIKKQGEAETEVVEKTFLQK
jgi:hypothetical protein